MFLQASGMVEVTSPKTDAQGSERWQQVANSLALTQNQVLSLVALRKSMRSRYYPNRQEIEDLTTFNITHSGHKRSPQLLDPC